MTAPRYLWLFLGLALSTPAGAQELLMARIEQDFNNATETVEAAIRSYGYTVSHIQRCDVALSKFGYKTDKYRIIFFGKLDEVRALTKKHPELAAFLPLKMAMIAEGEDTVLAIMNPTELSTYFPDPDLAVQFKRWESDERAILDDVRFRP